MKDNKGVIQRIICSLEFSPWCIQEIRHTGNYNYEIHWTTEDGNKWKGLFWVDHKGKVISKRKLVELSMWPETLC